MSEICNIKLAFVVSTPVEMEGEKERQWHERDKKENNDPEVNGRSDGSADNEEDNAESSELAALVWQEGYDRDNLSHPITHWEALNLRIAELEKQEEEKKEKMTKVSNFSFLLETLFKKLPRGILFNSNS